MYGTSEELQAAVDRYFDECRGVPAYDGDGIPIIKRNGQQLYVSEKPPTLSGIAHFLGYKDQRTFMRQKYRGSDFHDVVCEARLRIENFWEQALYDSASYYGAAHMLASCFHWRKESLDKAKQPDVVIVRGKSGEGRKAVPRG